MWRKCPQALCDEACLWMPWRSRFRLELAEVTEEPIHTATTKSLQPLQNQLWKPPPSIIVRLPLPHAVGVGPIMPPLPSSSSHNLQEKTGPEQSIPTPVRFLFSPHLL